ncbi:hypothetical protein Y032_0206g1978 [Ancylostoma ceylanicum]|uniref:Uncharacterized protein n=1 Tax=Ancylostoma ceylanicum TaxID=53326 RepID=A0A016SM45_9BILA|nr:hypothetical protein Y032_0206g1978 [Ancylostoma ceylanicum]
MSYFLAEKILELKFGGNWPLPVAWISLDFLPTYFLDFDFLGYLFQILSNGGDQQELLLCQLSESSTLLAQLGILVSEGLDRLMQNQGIAAIEEQSGEVDENGVEKRKHEYLRFGKRKHEYLRFGKRKHEYLSPYLLSFYNSSRHVRKEKARISPFRAQVDGLTGSSGSRPNENPFSVLTYFCHTLGHKHVCCHDSKLLLSIAEISPTASSLSPKADKTRTNKVLRVVEQTYHHASKA